MSKESNRQAALRYYYKNKKIILQKMKKYREAHRDYFRKKNKEWFQEKGKLRNFICRDKKRKWYQDNEERISKEQKSKYLKNRKVTLERNKKWKKSHMEMVCRNNKNRQAQLKGAKGKFSAQEWQSLKQKYHYTCLGCGKQEPEIKLSPDHIAPLCKGGTNFITNIQPLCCRRINNCQSKKGRKIIDYRPRYGAWLQA